MFEGFVSAYTSTSRNAATLFCLLGSLYFERLVCNHPFYFPVFLPFVSTLHSAGVSRPRAWQSRGATHNSVKVEHAFSIIIIVTHAQWILNCLGSAAFLPSKQGGGVVGTKGIIIRIHDPFFPAFLSKIFTFLENNLPSRIVDVLSFRVSHAHWHTHTPSTQ